MVVDPRFAIAKDLVVAFNYSAASLAFSFSLLSSALFFAISLYCCMTFFLTRFRLTLLGSYEYGAS
jgi:hypothetical protein